MGNFDTINSISDNIITVLKAKKIDIEVGIDPDKEVAGSKYPFGRVFNPDEDFQENHGEQSKYVNGVFLIRIYLRNTNEKELDREFKRWVHNIREAITINALNIGDLASTKYVSGVEKLEINKTVVESIGTLDYELQVRYREI